MVDALKRPGWYRAALCTVLAAAFGVGLVVAYLALLDLWILHYDGDAASDSHHSVK